MIYIFYFSSVIISIIRCDDTNVLHNENKVIVPAIVQSQMSKNVTKSNNNKKKISSIKNIDKVSFDVTSNVNLIHSIFDRYIDKLTQETRKKLEKEDIYILYDMQTYLQSTVIYADIFGDKYILKKLLELVSIPFEVKYIGDDQLWIDKVTLNDKDPLLATSQFFLLLTRVLSACEHHGVSTKKFRTEKIIKNHIYNNLKIIEDHLLKWVKNGSNISVSDVKINIYFPKKKGYLFLRVNTKKGPRYLVYNNEEKSRGLYGKKKDYIHVGLGKNFYGDWYLFDRNISQDIINVEADNQFLNITKIEINHDVKIKKFTIIRLFGDKKIEYDYIMDNKGFVDSWEYIRNRNNTIITTGKDDGVNVLQCKQMDSNKSKEYSSVRFKFKNREYLWDVPMEISDRDMFIFQSILQYSEYSVSIAHAYTPYYKQQYLKDTYQLILDGFSKDMSSGGYTFNYWSHIDSKNFDYSGYGKNIGLSDMFNSKGLPKLGKNVIATGMDISHGRRLNWLIETSLKYGESFDVKIPENIVKGYAKMIANKVCIGTLDNPHFTIYQNGSDTWYRVGYNNRSHFGYSPRKHDMDIHFITGSYGMLSKYNSKIKRWMKSWVKKHKNKMITNDRYVLDYLVSMIIGSLKIEIKTNKK